MDRSANRARTGDFDIDVIESAVNHFEREPHFGTSRDSVKEALFCMSINGEIVSSEWLEEH